MKLIPSNGCDSRFRWSEATACCSRKRLAATGQIGSKSFEARACWLSGSKQSLADVVPVAGFRCKLSPFGSGIVAARSGAAVAEVEEAERDTGSETEEEGLKGAGKKED